MADDTLRLGIDADASGVAAAAKDAERSLGRIGDRAKSETKNLNLYGERLGKVFGKNSGLHAKLDALEVPIRDVEGGFDRARQTAFVFGNAAETASEKATQGFLLAADSIAAFTSGGVAGIALTAAVAGFAFLSQAINEEAEAARKAEEETKKQAEALQNLAQQANAANVTISLLNAQTREKEVRERARFVEAERIATGKRHNALIDQLRKHEEDKRKASRVAQLKGAMAAIERTKKAIEIERAAFDKLDAEHNKSNERIRKARADVEKEMADNSENEITRLIGALEKKVTAGREAIEKVTGSAVRAVTHEEIMAKYADEQKAAEETQQALRKEDEAFEERQLKKQEAAKQRFLEGQRLLQEERIAAWETAEAKTKADEAAARTAKQVAAERISAFQKAHSVEIAAVTATISSLQQMAHDGELSFSKLADAAITAAGNQLVADGTKTLMMGVAKMFNPATAAIGIPEAAQGGLMISTGLAMGAAGGFIGRSGAAPGQAPAATTTPTDTRQSRAASSAGGGEGGTTVINFNGPAYDRRGVANVLTSGQKMARHRRVAGA